MNTLTDDGYQLENGHVTFVKGTGRDQNKWANQYDTTRVKEYKITNLHNIVLKWDYYGDTLYVFCNQFCFNLEGCRWWLFQKHIVYNLENCSLYHLVYKKIKVFVTIIFWATCCACDIRRASHLCTKRMIVSFNYFTFGGNMVGTIWTNPLSFVKI